MVVYGVVKSRRFHRLPSMMLSQPTSTQPAPKRLTPKALSEVRIFPPYCCMTTSIWHTMHCEKKGGGVPHSLFNEYVLCSTSPLNEQPSWYYIGFIKLCRFHCLLSMTFSRLTGT